MHVCCYCDYSGIKLQLENTVQYHPAEGVFAIGIQSAAL